MKQKKTAISPTREENFSEWYQQVVKKSDLAENSSVRGCMIIRPHGYALWENIQKILDKAFKSLGVKNAYFPLLIPLAAIQKEAEHVEGFSKECAVVTHRKLSLKDGVLTPDGLLEEPYIVRPTSEMIIGESFSKWVNSYRDLPLKVNQWANVMRWEMRPRIFLRTSEFLWQEGHTVHSNSEEAMGMTLEILELYKAFLEKILGIALIVGEKTDSEKFPGADKTFTVEAIMQDGKALQAGTSHFLGQNFSKAQEIKFADVSGDEKYAWTTSWGVSTRMIGGLIMSHGDDNGMLIPPRLSSLHVQILPFIKNKSDEEELRPKILELEKRISQKLFDDSSISVETDWRDLRGGEKYWETVRKGIPIIIEIGKRDLEKNQLVYTRRDTGVGSKVFFDIDNFVENLPLLLDEIQNNLFMQSQERLKASIVEIYSKEEFEKFLKTDFKPLKLGIAYLCDCEEVRNLLAEKKMSFRCMPLDQNEVDEKCIITGASVTRKVLFGQSY